MPSEQVPLRIRTSSLAYIVGENTFYPWENLTPPQQKSILQVIASQTPPSCIVYPETTEQLAQVIREANRNQWRVLPYGSGSKLSWGGLVQGADVVVSTEHLNKLIDHAVGDLTVTAEAGMKFSKLQEILAKANQFLALDPVTPSATLGGIVATADTGSLRQRYGSVRDQLLGITFVRADGQVAKAGGRVVKNVAGYDLMKLFTGSYGTLGVISQVTFRVYPIPEISTTVILTGRAEDVRQAAAILRNSALTPTQADLISTQLVSELGLGTGMGLIVRFQSIAESVQEQSNRLVEVGQNLGLQEAIYAGADEADLWQRLRESIHSGGNKSAIICKIGVLPTAAVEVLTRSPKGWIHIGSGLGVLRFEGEKGLVEMRSLCENHRGFLTILTAPVAVKQGLDVWGYTGNAGEMMRRIKLQFDEKGILSPGRFVDGI
ncbi:MULTISPECIES: FAD-binding oxidoreductase [Fischerella]|uniref:FAD-binding oxidoreductase n=1 Tax=Fischerella muscicola CCMEE 5323 TaxID=2019572 RepID=A0A2N6K315_FISMU|nr:MULTISPECIES: FAD-binding oxidoreductase [Fischerella]MBD2429879.1 FAD-binding oxidoreductase [Fischerella sp. FACHB-380]PLZ89740.1 FAD-binding oxidoreductase [Fischerella muscicola CCMEE 5323]